MELNEQISSLTSESDAQEYAKRLDAALEVISAKYPALNEDFDFDLRQKPIKTEVQPTSVCVEVGSITTRFETLEKFWQFDTSYYDPALGEIMYLSKAEFEKSIQLGAASLYDLCGVSLNSSDLIAVIDFLPKEQSKYADSRLLYSVINGQINMAQFMEYTLSLQEDQRPKIFMGSTNPRMAVAATRLGFEIQDCTYLSQPPQERAIALDRIRRQSYFSEHADRLREKQYVYDAYKSKNITPEDALQYGINLESFDDDYKELSVEIDNLATDASRELGVKDIMNTHFIYRVVADPNIVCNRVLESFNSGQLQRQLDLFAKWKAKTDKKSLPEHTQTLAS